LIRTCTVCGFSAEADEIELWFPIASSMGTRTHRCVGCRQTEGDRIKQGNRFLAKARSTLKRHAAKYGQPIEDFAVRFNWSVRQLAHDMEFQYGNGCSYCHGNYQKMGHGLQDITVDIVDRTRDPYYGTNVKLCCGTCNKAKGDLPPWKWELKLSLWRRWLRWVAEHPRPEQIPFAFLG
jgi:hypothetical protein